MDELATRARDIAAVQRGQIIQRVLVDGWSPGQAAAAFGVEERRVARWISAYRRHGMASLRDDRATERDAGCWRRWLRRIRMRVLPWLHGKPAQAEPAPCVELRRGRDHSRG